MAALRSGVYCTPGRVSYACGCVCLSAEPCSCVHATLPSPAPLLPQNSNLVLTAEQRTSAGREPDGSAESLWGRMKGQMGDRVTRERPEGLQKKPARKREAGEGEAFDLPKRRKVGTGPVRGPKQHRAQPLPSCCCRLRRCLRARAGWQHLPPLHPVPCCWLPLPAC